MPKQDNEKYNLMLSHRFEHYRKAKGLSYREIGDAFGKTEAAIRLASKRNSINEGFIRTLSEKFDINLTWALTGNGDMFNPDFIAADYKTVKTIDEIIDEKVDKKIAALREEMLLTAKSIILKELKNIKNNES